MNLHKSLGGLLVLACVVPGGRFHAVLNRILDGVPRQPECLVRRRSNR